MSPSQRSNEIYTSYYLYVKGDKKQAGDFLLEELKFALIEYSQETGKPAYKAIELKAAELEKKAREKRACQEKWLFALVAFVSGIVATILAQLLLRKYF